jgi:hypothetical protein
MVIRCLKDIDEMQRKLKMRKNGERVREIEQYLVLLGIFIGSPNQTTNRVTVQPINPIFSLNCFS